MWGHHTCMNQSLIFVFLKVKCGNYILKVKFNVSFVGDSIFLRFLFPLGPQFSLPSSLSYYFCVSSRYVRPIVSLSHPWFLLILINSHRSCFCHPPFPLSLRLSMIHYSSVFFLPFHLYQRNFIAEKYFTVMNVDKKDWLHSTNIDTKHILISLQFIWSRFDVTGKYERQLPIGILLIWPQSDSKCNIARNGGFWFVEGGRRLHGKTQYKVFSMKCIIDKYLLFFLCK